MENKEVMELLKILSDAINLCDSLGLDYGDELMQMIIEIKERYKMED